MLGAGLTVYLRVRKHWLSVRVVPYRGQTVQVEGTARVAARNSRKGASEIVGIGNEADACADAPGVSIHDAFCHPRVLIGGFDDAALVTGEFLRRACGGTRPLLRFRMVIDVAEELEGGLTDVEERALKELGLRLGVGSVAVRYEAKPREKESQTRGHYRASTEGGSNWPMSQRTRL